MRGSIPPRHLGLVRLLRALEQLELLGTALFGSFTVFWRDSIWINQLLRCARTDPQENKGQDNTELQGKSGRRSPRRCNGLRNIIALNHRYPPAVRQEPL